MRCDILPTYLHSDHLGSPLAATDATGAVLWREAFTPFGESRQNPAANDNNEHFKGHIADTNSGIEYVSTRTRTAKLRSTFAAFAGYARAL